MLSPIEAIFEIKFGGGVVVVVDFGFAVTVGKFVAFSAIALRKLAINTTNTNLSFIAAIFLRAKLNRFFHRFYFCLPEQLEILSLH